jgi:UDP-N-acetylglucosamine 2-epimerase (non-hydrolysing)
MKIAIVFGTRPQYIKLAPLIQELQGEFDLCTIDTGQHYDESLSGQFVSEFQMPKPTYVLNVGSGAFGKQLGSMMSRLEPVLRSEKPSLVLVMGDTNSTLAGALMGSRLGIPIAHLEAGVRNFDRKMPEEINRVMVDAISDLLLCPTEASANNLIREGRTTGVFLTGDIMGDSLEMSLRRLDVDSCLKQHGLTKGQYIYLTLHRPSNVDDPDNLRRIVNALNESDQKIIFPIHPRTRKNLEKFGLIHLLQPNIVCIDPVPHNVSICLAKCASKVLTDSGGLQKEAYLLRTPCITLRSSTEWPETVALGWNRLVGTDTKAISDAILRFECNGNEHPDFLGSNVAERIRVVLRGFEGMAE